MNFKVKSASTGGFFGSYATKAAAKADAEAANEQQKAGQDDWEAVECSVRKAGETEYRGYMIYPEKCSDGWGWSAVDENNETVAELVEDCYPTQREAFADARAVLDNMVERRRGSRKSRSRPKRKSRDDVTALAQNLRAFSQEELGKFIQALENGELDDDEENFEDYLDELSRELRKCW